MLQRIAIFLLGIALLFSITFALIATGYLVSVFRESTTSAQWGTQPILLHDCANSTIILQCSPLRPIIRLLHNGSDCQHWPVTQQWVCDLCKIDSEEDCNGKSGNMLWTCNLYFLGYQLSPNTEALNEHYRKLKNKKDIVGISLGSTFVLILLLALGGCMWRQKRDQCRTHVQELDRSLPGRQLRCGKRVEDGNSTKSARRVPVLPIAQPGRNSGHSNDAQLEERSGPRGRRAVMTPK
jgi:hypothetical protein